ncbi:MAG: VOC family protein [Bacteroidales bacterium]
MKTLNVYLTFNGNCLEAFNFYKSVFGGEFDSVGKFGEMPPQEGYEIQENEKEKIMHISLPISKETVLMGSDTSSSYGEVIFGNNISLSIDTSEKEEADRIFDELADGGKITMSMNNTFWGSYFGMLTDKFGINWMVSFDNNQQ